MDNREFTVHDRLGPLTVTGQLLADQRFGSQDYTRKPRYTDMALYGIVETQQNRRVTVSCQGCTPARSLLVSEVTLHDAPVVCGRCEKPFLPDASQEDEPFRYVLEVIARSWVYHDINGPCKKTRHSIQTVGDVYKSVERWRNLVPCNRCNPPDLQDMKDGERIAQERHDTHLYLCTDPLSIVKRLYHRSGEISVLAARLLREAAVKDPAIATAWQNRKV